MTPAWRLATGFPKRSTLPEALTDQQCGIAARILSFLLLQGFRPRVRKLQTSLEDQRERTVRKIFLGVSHSGIRHLHPRPALRCCWQARIYISDHGKSVFHISKGRSPTSVVLSRQSTVNKASMCPIWQPGAGARPPDTSHLLTSGAPRHGACRPPAPHASGPIRAAVGPPVPTAPCHTTSHRREHCRSLHPKPRGRVPWAAGWHMPPPLRGLSLNVLSGF